MDWKLAERERLKKLFEERDRLLAMSDLEAERLPVPDRYQRMRYQREIEAAAWLAGVRRNLPVSSGNERPVKYRYAKKTVQTYDKFND